MPVQLNPKGVANAKQLIKDGKVDRDTPWSWDADDQNKILGDQDWAEYSGWFLGIDDAENSDTKAHYKYPIGKEGKVYRSALIGDRQRSGQQHDQEIFDAAGELIEMIDKDQDSDKGKKDSRAPLDAWRVETASRPWAMIPGFIPRRVLAPRANSPRVGPVLTRSPNSLGGAIAVISLTGVISQHPDWFADTSVDEFAADLMSAVNDPGVGAILVSIDSPGGSVYGVQEVAQMMMGAREQKPIVALANSLAASAAYWIGCSASEFYCMPSGEVGSIGVWQAHMDFSGMLDQAGIKTTLISAGKYKVEGNPYEPLDDDALGFMQSRVDDYYGAFVNGVAQARGTDPATVKNGMGQGRVLGAQDARNAGMIDGIATMPQVIRSMQKKMSAVPSKKASNIAGLRHSLSLLG
ncbi:MAG: S49 family peptidase [Betaproteobacteria bacterium]|nr:S49 family peptidase [Betaproteobacteria bacterium]